LNVAQLTRYLTASLVFGACALPMRLAWAGCPNPCEVDVEPPILEPAVDACTTPETHGDTCDCGITASLVNACNADLVASDFTFNLCESPIDHFVNCTTVQPQGRGWIDRHLDIVGPAEFTFTLQTERGEEHLTLKGNVKKFEDGCVCSVVAPAGGNQRSALLVAMELLVGSAFIRRVARRKAPN
jgi:hypothetical protein